MLKVGIVGWRGMVGSVMLNRMLKENDFNNFEPFFFSTSKIGRKIGPVIDKKKTNVGNAYSLKKLAKMDIIISCQGSQYTRHVHKRLRDINWRGYWIDSSSELRMKKKSIIVLDPINIDSIIDAISNGVLDYIGGNCTVSLMLMALHGLLKRGWVEWIISMTYQAISGAGSNKLKEMMIQMQNMGIPTSNLINEYLSDIPNINKKSGFLLEKNKSLISQPTMFANLIPWIGKAVGNGQTEEEFKAFLEVNKILNLNKDKLIYVDGQCVRVCTIRCHSQALTLKLKKQVTIGEIEAAIKTSNKWVKLIENNKKTTICNLNPASVSGTLNILIGRLRKLNIASDKYLTAFTVGDQLLWGAAEPIRRTLKIIVNYIS